MTYFLLVFPHWKTNTAVYDSCTCVYLSREHSRFDVYNVHTKGCKTELWAIPRFIVAFSDVASSYYLLPVETYVS